MLLRRNISRSQYTAGSIGGYHWSSDASLGFQTSGTGGRKELCLKYEETAIFVFKGGGPESE